MSSLNFQLATDISPLKVSATYSKSDYSLLVAPNMDLPALKHHISIDSLTLSFHPKSHMFLSLDAYTNHERWHLQNLDLPRIDKVSSLISADYFDENGIGESISTSLKFTFSNKNSLLHIKIRPQIAMIHIKCLSNIIFGLHTSGQLVEIWVPDLAIVP